MGSPVSKNPSLMPSLVSKPKRSKGNRKSKPMDPEKKKNFIFPTKYVIPKSLKFSHWPSKKILRNANLIAAAKHVQQRAHTSHLEKHPHKIRNTLQRSPTLHTHTKKKKHPTQTSRKVISLTKTLRVFLFPPKKNTLYFAPRPGAVCGNRTWVLCPIDLASVERRKTPRNVSLWGWRREFYRDPIYTL